MATVQIDPRCDRSGNPYPAPLAASSQRWLKAYQTHRGEKAYLYSRQTVELMIDYGVLKPKEIGDRGADCLQRNQRLGNLGFASGFNDAPENRKVFPPEDFGNHPRVVEGFDTLCGLRANDLGAQNPEIYAKLLQVPSLGTLVRMVELMQYYGVGLISRNELARLPPRFYLGNGEVDASHYKRIAQVAHKLYGPLAEFFGYTKRLAGDLDQMSYYYLKRSFYDKVISSLRQMHPRVRATTRIMDVVVPQLRNVLPAAGYECDIFVRDRKHPGRVMEKMERKLKEAGGRIEDHVSALKDLAAFTVVLHTYKDKPVAEIERFQEVANIIAALVMGLNNVKGAGDMGNLEVTFTDHISQPKPNGYQSLHADMVFENPNLAGMEALIRNTHMDCMARNGGAAHYLYKGAGAGFEAVQLAYQRVKEIIFKELGLA
ncbi:MAG: hypothetical protein PHV13_06170 [Candidatus ainarchaeum sp.]|nr:hypothetical protein [Candidatus ainarchaeum sp.]